jgi:hypothetical protein
MRKFTTMGLGGAFVPPLGQAQALMLLGKWHQQDSKDLRCRHGFKNKDRCPGCNSARDGHREVG